MKLLCYVIYHSILLIISSSLTVSAQAASDTTPDNNKDKIIWVVEDKKENINLLAKKTPDTSTASYIESMVISKLTQYNVDLSRGSMKRATHFLKTKKNVCVANRFNLPERREYSLFSNPQAFYISHKLYRYNQSNPLPVQLFNSSGELSSIHDVFTALPNSIIGIAQAVSFGTYLDHQVAQIPKENIYYRGGNNRVSALENMLFTGRIQFLLALPLDVTPTTEQKVTLEQYSIAGNPPYAIAHISCSKSELGEKVIKDINKILAKMYETPDYYLAHKKWFPDNEIEKLQLFLKKKYADKTYIKTDVLPSDTEEPEA